MFQSMIRKTFVSQNVKNFNKFMRGISASSVSKGKSNLNADNIVRSEHHIADADIPDMSLTEYVFRDHGRWKDQAAVICGETGRSYTFAELFDLSLRVARGLLSKTGLGLDENDVVGIILPNIPEFAAVVYGATEAGFVVTFANPLYTAEEVCRQFTDAGVKCIFTIPAMLPVSQAYQLTTSNYKGTVLIGGENNLSNKVMSFQSFVNADHSANLPKIATNQVAILPYSSGTTGLPKGVMLTHKNLVYNLVQGMHTSINRFTIPNCPDLNAMVLTVPPFFHIYGLNCILNYGLSLGSGVLSIPKFTPEAYIKCLVEYRPKVLSLVPSLLLFLATHPSVKTEHLSSVMHINVGAAPVSTQIIEKYKMKAHREVFIAQGYGMTETSPALIITPLDAPPTKGASTGKLYPNTEARIVSATDGTNLGAMQPGELYVRGEQVMKGYLNNPEATKEILDEDGWLHTGDVAYYDEDNYFYIVDRTKELIKVKGNQVSPSELENVIIELSDIADVAVVGMLDEISGEVPKAFVVLKPQSKLTEDEIIDYVKSKVANYKQLRGGVKFIKTIPRNPSGKILRKDLKLIGEQYD